MSVILPNSPAPSDAVPSYLDWGGVLRPIFGGVLQKLLRLGDRFAIDVNLPPLTTEADGRIWTAMLMLAQRQGAVLSWPQPGLIVGNPGAPAVNGTGQAGSILVLRGFQPGYVVRMGQFFSILHGGRRYLHFAAADGTANAQGLLQLPIGPMLRIRPSDGAVCEFAAPKIEGLLDGNTRDWTLNTALMTGLNVTSSAHA
ncbi:hypothetical protein C8J45_103304 [Sphingomonas sp. PP-CE-3G-477]|uniref:hypothetical protein n=1 Tax=Sphingomonas sp. PP-CE-3G-477 TaxID=2135660 RepID=UPI000D35597B|nr:hypothetical protein [Sphingomonas sp. PP-CE-3G-477]PTQ64455.1 hypothetical protein C8J45_103304 [Sphingomonas sp. PP-CE-3G-477]